MVEVQTPARRSSRSDHVKRAVAIERKRSRGPFGKPACRTRGRELTSSSDRRRPSGGRVRSPLGPGLDLTHEKPRSIRTRERRSSSFELGFSLSRSACARIAGHVRFQKNNRRFREIRPGLPRQAFAGGRARRDAPRGVPRLILAPARSPTVLLEAKASVRRARKPGAGAAVPTESGDRTGGADGEGVPSVSGDVAGTTEGTGAGTTGGANRWRGGWSSRRRVGRGATGTDRGERPGDLPGAAPKRRRKRRGKPGARPGPTSRREPPEPAAPPRCERAAPDRDRIIPIQSRTARFTASMYEGKKPPGPSLLPHDEIRFLED